MRFVTIKKRTLCILIGILLCICLVLGTMFAVRQVSVPRQTYTVVIDAGHGGIDGGCVGKNTGVYESDLNLAYAKLLKEQLENMGISTLLTRTNADGLYDDGVKNRKKSDMQKRKQIIDSANPVLVISIHMNSYVRGESRGAQAFYKKGNEQGKKLCEDVQQELHSMLDYAGKTAKEGDYYMVNCTDRPSVLIECGFLSNAQEEKLLIDLDYQQKVCYAISCGVVRFLNEK